MRIGSLSAISSSRSPRSCPEGPPRSGPLGKGLLRRIPYRERLVFSTTFLALAFTLIVLSGCGASQQFPALPPGVDLESVPKQSVDMTAERFRFVPDLIRVKEGTLVTINVRSIQGTHGFSLGAFGIDEEIGENETMTVKFFASKQGEYSFHCSHFCGIGHLGMNGKVIVEP